MNWKPWVVAVSAAFACGAGEARAQCLNNVVANGDFSDGLAFGSMPAATAANWSLLTASPQITNDGCNAPASLYMWGNLVVGESVKQTLPGAGIVAGKSYRVSLNYRLHNPAPYPADEVSVRLAVSSSAPGIYPPLAGYNVIGIAPRTSSTSCVSHTFPVWTAPGNASYLTLNPENDSSFDHGSYVSWANVDDLCIQELRLEHFSGYQAKPTKGAAKFSKFGPLVLADQFGSAKYDVVKPSELLLPADKNDEGLIDSDTHLEEYRIKARSDVAVVTPVRVTNQCNDLALEVGKVRSLLVPTAKTPPPGVEIPAAPDPLHHNVDHFLCYKAKSAKLDGGGSPQSFPRGTQVSVVDQFETLRYDLKKITKICNPVGKSTDPEDLPVILSGSEAGTAKPVEPASIRNPDDRLVCYQAKLAKKLIAQSGCGCDEAVDPKCKGTAIEPAQLAHVPITAINVNNQFGAQVLDTKKHVEICIPSQQIPLI